MTLNSVKCLWFQRCRTSQVLGLGLVGHGLGLVGHVLDSITGVKLLQATQDVNHALLQFSNIIGFSVGKFDHTFINVICNEMSSYLGCLQTTDLRNKHRRLPFQKADCIVCYLYCGNHLGEKK